MKRYVAFLRGMNLGGRRITNEELCARVASLGLADVTAFLASGNVVFGAARGTPASLTRKLEKGLGEALGYDVPTYVRSAEQVRALAACDPFPPAQTREMGKLQVALLRAEPPAAVRRSVLELGGPDDRLAFTEGALFWLPRGPLPESELDLAAIARALGPLSIRTKRTVDRLAAKYFVEGAT